MRKIKLLIYLSISYLFYSNNAFGLETLDSNKILSTAKLIAYVQGGNLIDSFNELKDEISTASAYFLKESGFFGVRFIKVKVRFRFLLEYKVFNSCLTDSEYHYYARQAAIAPEIIRDKIFKCYNITKNTPNDSLESILKANPDYASGGWDCYLIYLIQDDRLVVLRTVGKLNYMSTVCDVEYIRSLIEKGEITEPQLKNNMTIKNEENVKKKLYIEELGVDWL